MTLDAEAALKNARQKNYRAECRWHMFSQRVRQQEHQQVFVQRVTTRNMTLNRFLGGTKQALSRALGFQIALFAQTRMTLGA